MRSQTAKKRRRGFTLVEMMVSLAAGGIALSSIYAIGSASTRHFREQQRVANAQTSLRSATDLIKRDFQRAGYLATPNSMLPGEACGQAPTSITAAAIVGFVDNNSNFKDIADPQRINPGSTFDEVFLMGNYSNTGEYSGISEVSKALITVNRTSQSFRRDFNDWADPDNYDYKNFDNLFRIGRMVRIHSRTNETFHFSRIAGRDGAATVPSITLDANIPATCSPSGGWASVVNTFHYHIVAPTADATKDDEAARVAGLGAYALLKRTEVDANRTGPLLDSADNQPLDDRTILDYVVAFNLSFRAAPGNVVNWTPVVTKTAMESLVNSNPQQIRSVIIELAVRTPEIDPTLAWISNPVMRTFKVDNTNSRPGASRVRTTRSEVLLSNLAFKAY